MSEARESSQPRLLLIGMGVLLILGILLCIGQPVEVKEQPTSTPACPTSIPELLVPTRTPVNTAAIAPTTAEPSPLPSLPPTAMRTPQQVSFTAALWRGKPRWGIGVASRSISHYDVEPLRLGWYLDWRAQLNPPRPGDVEYTPMVRLVDDVLQPDAETIAAIAQANPGSLWLIGNEPDVKWQDNVKPEAYARLYHEAYTTIKAADPTAQVAIGGIVQPTPLRLRYLEIMLAAYYEQFGAEAPMDAWHVHNFILREASCTAYPDSCWGCGVPSGLPDGHGMLYEIEDNDNLEIFQQQLVDFRRWMAGRGYQNLPLIVSEYGIPMPEDYGFSPERVIAFLRGTFDFFLTATDRELGFPGDGYRLVQRWCWYSLNASDSYYPQGRLFDPSTGDLTAVGEGWVEYMEGRAFSQEWGN